jgi:signal transduction histidine kinase
MHLDTIVVAVALDYLINVVLMPGVTPYTPWGTVATAGLVAAPSWWLVIGQRLALTETRDRLVATLAARDAAEAASVAKSQFLAAMSHELRTPLNAIIGYSEIMAETAEEEARATDIADHGRVLGSARQLLRMVDDVLELSGLESGGVTPRPAPFSVLALVRAAVQAVGPAAAARGNRVSLAVGNDVGAACTDGQRLTRCLSHLLANAVRFTQNGEIAVSVRRRGDDLVFAIADTGCGIAPENMGRLFQSFSQIDASSTRQYGGAGVGLALTRGIARLLGGDVTVVSTLGRGSVFTLVTPAIYRSAEERAAAAADPRVVAMRAA